MKVIHGNYIYVGFSYRILEDESGRLWSDPHKGQHSAAHKYKHCMAAVDCFKQEFNWDER